MDKIEKIRCKSLEEAAEEYANKEFPNEPAIGQWGTGDYEPPVDMEYPREIAKEAFIAGINWQKEQMLKDAVGGMVCATITNQVAISFFSPLPKELKVGDKIRIVLIKESTE